ncbi:hypothetical protein GCM10028862_22010 [Luteimonas pelagia]
MALVLAACARDTDRAPARADSPAAAVERLLGFVRSGDAAGYADHAVPPALRPQLEAAWRDGRGRWPVTELPFGNKLPAMLATLSAEGSEARLHGAFDAQFAGADRELRAAAMSLSLFGSEFVRTHPRLGKDERDHYARLVEAVGAWGRDAPLSDRARAHAAIDRLAAAARESGLASPGDLRSAGMADSLRRLQPFFTAWLATFADYGLDLDAALADARIEVVEQRGRHARVRLSYTLAGEPVEARIAVRRIDGRWYPEDSLRHVQQALSRPATPMPADTPASTPPTAAAASP